MPVPMLKSIAKKEHTSVGKAEKAWNAAKHSKSNPYPEGSPKHWAYVAGTTKKIVHNAHKGESMNLITRIDALLEARSPERQKRFDKAHYDWQKGEEKRVAAKGSIEKAGYTSDKNTHLGKGGSKRNPHTGHEHLTNVYPIPIHRSVARRSPRAHDAVQKIRAEK